MEQTLDIARIGFDKNLNAIRRLRQITRSVSLIVRTTSSALCAWSLDHGRDIGVHVTLGWDADNSCLLKLKYSMYSLKLANQRTIGPGVVPRRIPRDDLGKAPDH